MDQTSGNAADGSAGRTREHPATGEIRDHANCTAAYALKRLLRRHVPLVVSNCTSRRRKTTSSEEMKMYSPSKATFTRLRKQSPQKARGGLVPTFTGQKGAASAWINSRPARKTGAQLNGCCGTREGHHTLAGAHPMIQCRYQSRFCARRKIAPLQARRGEVIGVPHFHGSAGIQANPQRARLPRRARPTLPITSSDRG